VVEADPTKVNGAIVDQFALGHLAVGAFYGRLQLPWCATLALAIGWELLERPAKAHRPDLFPHPSQDSAPNALIDVAAVMVGWAYARQR